MPDAVRVRVPGKLMLTGEYAVLAGAPSVVTCVDRFVTVHATPVAGAEGAVEVLAGQRHRQSYTVRQGRVEWPDSRDEFALVRAVFGSVCPPAPLEIRIDSTDFFDADRKLGLGSSAAVAVALVAALSNAERCVDVMALAVDAHREFQNGRGSGADVRAVASGGTVAQHAHDGSVALETLNWPDGLHMMPVVAERSASTVDHIDRFRTWQRDAQDASRRLQQAADAADDVVTEWRRADPEAIIEAMDVYTQHISGIDAAAALGYKAGGQERLEAIARQAGCHFKPSGAGGGDIGLVYTSDPDRLHECRQLAAASGVHVPTLSLAGVQPELRRSAA